VVDLLTPISRWSTDKGPEDLRHAGRAGALPRWPGPGLREGAADRPVTRGRLPRAGSTRLARVGSDPLERSFSQEL
jgi:hypothetical protein